MTLETEASVVCEKILEAEYSYNAEHEIFPSYNEIINRMLERGLELKAAYVDLYQKADGSMRELRSFFDLLLYVGTFWTPVHSAQARADRSELEQMNREIANLASKLSNLLARREDTQDRSRFFANTHYHPIDIIENAASDHWEFNNYLREPLAQLRGQFDLKYWPTVSQLLQEVARDAEQAEVRPMNKLTAAGVGGKRPSKADFLKCFFAALQDRKDGQMDSLSSKFRLSDATVASLMNIVLDLEPEDLVGSEYVKAFRQRLREAK